MIFSFIFLLLNVIKSVFSFLPRQLGCISNVFSFIKKSGMIDVLNGSSTSDSIANVYLQKELMGYKDIKDARRRDIKIRKYNKNNFRADIIIVGALLGVVVCLLLIILFRHSLTGDMIIVLTSIMGFFSSIITDASVFEFGGHSRKQINKKRKNI